MPVGKLLLLVLVLVAVAAGGSALAGPGQRDQPSKPRAGGFAQGLAAELSLPVAQVREALKAVREDRRAERAARRGLRAQQRKHAATRAERRRHRAERRTVRGRAPGLRPLRRLVRLRDHLAPDLAAKLGIAPATVTAA